MDGGINTRHRGFSGLQSGMLLIKKIVVGADFPVGNSVIFTAIPQYFTSLRLYAKGRCSDAVVTVGSHVRYNGDSGANYTDAYMFNSAGTLTAASSGGSTFGYAGQFTGSTAGANLPGTYIVDIPFYSDNLFTKNTHSWTYIQGFQYFMSSSWNNVSPIYQITCFDQSGGNFNIGSQFALYGIY